MQTKGMCVCVCVCVCVRVCARACVCGHMQCICCACECVCLCFYLSVCTCMHRHIQEKSDTSRCMRERNQDKTTIGKDSGKATYIIGYHDSEKSLVVRVESHVEHSGLPHYQYCM